MRRGGGRGSSGGRGGKRERRVVWLGGGVQERASQEDGGSTGRSRELTSEWCHLERVLSRRRGEWKGQRWEARQGSEWEEEGVRHLWPAFTGEV